MQKFEKKQSNLQCDQTVLIAFLSIVHADSKFKPREKAELCRIFQGEFGYSSAVAESLTTELKQISADKDTFEDSLKYFSEKEQDPRIRGVLLEMLYRLASCDHHVSPEEEAVLHRAGVLLQTDQEACNALDQRYLAHLTENGRYEEKGGEPWYVILGVAEDSDLFVVREAYTKLIDKFHPANLKGEDLDPLILEFAEIKYHEIKEAFQQAEMELQEAEVGRHDI